MKIRGAKNSTPPKGLEKVPTGSAGLDEITGGGLPKGRPTLVCGAAGCDKTMLGIAFLAHGALEHNESGVFMAFEENADELAANVASLGIDLGQLLARKKLIVDSVRLERSEIEETGEYDLSGLFIRLGEAIDAIGAKRVVLDTIEVLFAGLTNHGIVRAELRRLFRWLKDKGVTAFITAEQGNGGGLTRYGLEEYVADCVIRLDQRVTDQISTRPPAHRQVSGFGPRHQRVSLPHHRERRLGAAGHFHGSGAPGQHQTDRHGGAAARRPVGGPGLLPRQQRSGFGRNWNRQDNYGRRLRRRL